MPYTEKESGPAGSFDPGVRFLFRNIPASRNSVISIPNTIFFLNTASRANLANPGRVQIPYLVKKFCLLLNIALYFVQIPDPEIPTLSIPCSESSVTIKVTEEGMEWARAKVFLKSYIFNHPPFAFIFRSFEVRKVSKTSGGLLPPINLHSPSPRKGRSGELRGGETEETLAYDETGLDLTGHINKKSMNKPYSPGIPFHDHHRPLKQSLRNLCAISELEL